MLTGRLGSIADYLNPRNRESSPFLSGKSLHEFNRSSILGKQEVVLLEVIGCIIECMMNENIKLFVNKLHFDKCH